MGLLQPYRKSFHNQILKIYIRYFFRKILRHEQEARPRRVGPLQEVSHQDGQSGRVLESC